MSHTFYIPLQTDDVAALLEKAKRLTEENGGTFTGDAQAGHFAAEGVKGAYGLAEKSITIVLTDKPWMITWSYVEGIVRSFFSH